MLRKLNGSLKAAWQTRNGRAGGIDCYKVALRAPRNVMATSRLRAEAVLSKCWEAACQIYAEAL